MAVRISKSKRKYVPIIEDSQSIGLRLLGAHFRESVVALASTVERLTDTFPLSVDDHAGVERTARVVLAQT